MRSNVRGSILLDISYYLCERPASASNPIASLSESAANLDVTAAEQGSRSPGLSKPQSDVCMG